MDNYEDGGRPDDDREEPSTLGETELYLKMRKWFRVDAAHSNEWREQAKKDFNFRANDQWDDKTAKYMTEQEGKVPIVFNRVLPVIKAVAGVEINTRHETIYLPRQLEVGDIQANEDLTAASKWMGDGCNAAHQESMAFQDVLTCGMGWVEERMDYELEPDGKYIEEKLDPLEMYWDSASRQMNLTDSRRRWRLRKMAWSDARAMFPDADDDDLNNTWAMGMEGDEAIKSIEERRLKRDNNLKEDPDGEVTILQCQWWEREKYHRVANPFTGQVEDMDDDQLKALVKQAKMIGEQTGQFYPVESVKATRRVYKQAFIGSKILKKGPCPRSDGFTLHCITGELHATKGTWFGLVAMMRDPQMMANKWLSQTTHIINTTAKGGILAEEDAFTDINEAKATYAKPDAITFVKKGAVANGKIMQKPGVGLAGPYIQLLQMAIEAIPQVTGINMEMMGLREVNQPGVLEAQRKQAAMTILATIFDALNLFRIEVGRTRLHFIQNYIEDGKIIRVLSNDGRYRGVQLIKSKMVGDYDVIVEEAPSSPNNKEETWRALQVVLPAMGDLIDPPLAVQLLNYVPGLPQQLIQDFQASLEQRMNEPPPPEVEMQKQLAIEGQAAQVQKDKASAMKDAAQAEKMRAETEEKRSKVVLNQASAFSEQMKAAKEKALAAKASAEAINEMMPDPADYAIRPIQNMRQYPQVPQLPTVAQDDGDEF